METADVLSVTLSRNSPLYTGHNEFKTQKFNFKQPGHVLHEN